MSEELGKLRQLEIKSKRKPAFVRKPYTMTPEALAQRREAAKLSTGPKDTTATRLNAWKHGQYCDSLISRIMKPCFSTCAAFETCEHVTEGRTRPGDPCLNREDMLNTLDIIGRAIQKQEAGQSDFEQIMAVELAGALEIVRVLRDEVLANRCMSVRQKLDEDGGVIAEEWVLHPGLMALPKLLENLGITFRDWNITPAQISKVKSDDKAAETAADLMARLAGQVRGAGQ